MNTKIKLVFFHPYSQLGGADNSLKRLIENLDHKIYSITLVTLNDSYLKKFFKKKIIFKKLKAKRAIFSIFELKKIVNDYSKNAVYKKVIVISNQNFANIVTSFAIKKNNKIKTIYIDRNHLDELDYFNNFKDKVKKKIIKILIKYRYSKADAIIGICKKLSNDLEKFINRKVKTIYSPAFDKNIIIKSKAKLNLSSKFKYILNVSRFSKRKDHITTLKAFEIVVRKIKNIKLILIGYGPELEKIKLLAKNLKISNKILIINKTYNPYNYMKKSKLLILTSVYEGLANVLIEALTIGTPVISTNSNAGPSEILLNGKGGDLVKVGDFKNLAKRIIIHFKSPNKLNKKTIVARKNLKRFDPKVHSKIYSKLFNQM